MNPGDESVVNHILKANAAEVKATIDEVQVRKSQKMNKHGASKSYAIRDVGTIPPSVYWHFYFKYRKNGRNIWDDEKFRKQFFDTYHAFRVCEKY